MYLYTKKKNICEKYENGQNYTDILWNIHKK